MECFKHVIYPMFGLSKAFYSLNRTIFRSKLEFYRIQGVSLQWFKSYLSARDQFFPLNDKASDTAGVELGVAQGNLL